MTDTPNTAALQALLMKVEAGDWWGDLPRPAYLHTDLCWKAFNGSLDAAKALHEAVLPECAWFIESAYRGDAPTAAIEGHCISVQASDDNPARAWLIAILRALIAALSTPDTEPQGYVEGEVGVIEAAQWARNRLEIIADESWHGDGRDLKRSIIGVFADFDEALAARPAPQPAADTRVVTDAMIVEIWERAQQYDPDELFIELVRAIIGTATPAQSDKIAEAARDVFYIDCEFDGHSGPLLSIAMVRQDGYSLHVKVDVEAIDPWVIENVMPIMDKHAADVSRIADPDYVGHVLRNFIGDCRTPSIIADSPVDIARFCRAISTGVDGGWASADYAEMRFIVRNVDCYPTALEGAVQHNAWWDAKALRALAGKGETP